MNSLTDINKITSHPRSPTSSCRKSLITEKAKEKVATHIAYRMDSRPRNVTPMRDEEVKKFKESQEILDKLFKGLLGVLALKSTDTGDRFFTEHPIVTAAALLMIVLFFLLWMLGTMIRHRVDQCLAMIFAWIILLIGSICSVLVLATIYPLIAWFTGMLWIGIFGIIGYYFYQNLYELFLSSVSDAIKKLSESYKLQSTRVPV